MEFLELFQRLAVALAIGLMIGIERGWQTREEHEGDRTAGMRTFAISGLLGGVSGAMAVALPEGGAIFAALAFVSYSATIAAYRFRELVHEDRHGVTTVVAAMLTFVLGAYAVIGDPVIAAAVAVASAALLGLKTVLHSWLQRITWEELRAALILLTMTLILLPTLPNRTLDPFSAFNPRDIWIMTILIAALSFAGYIAIKLAGARLGVMLAGFAGGLASSTATTISMANMARRDPKHVSLFMAGAILSTTVMTARVIFVAGLFNPALLQWLLPTLGLAGVTLLAVAGLMFLVAGTRTEATSVEQLKNPFELGSVLKFGLLLTVITVASKLVAAHAGAGGLNILAFVSGIADVDAITLSIARLGTASVSNEQAAVAILIVVLSNALAKIGFAWIEGGWEAGWRILAATAVAALVGLAAFNLATSWNPQNLLDALRPPA